MLISEPYRELNRALIVSGWGNSAGAYADTVRELAAEFGTVLDYGCGQGVLRREMGFIHEYDPCVYGKEATGPADLVCCIDVLEHIEPEFLDNVLRHVASLARKAAFFVISTQPAATILADGRNAHLTIQGKEWWRKKLGEHFSVIEEQPGTLGFYQCVVKP